MMEKIQVNRAKKDLLKLKYKPLFSQVSMH
jgi:hypothetical protein